MPPDSRPARHSAPVGHGSRPAPELVAGALRGWHIPSMIPWPAGQQKASVLLLCTQEPPPRSGLDQQSTFEAQAGAPVQTRPLVDWAMRMPGAQQVYGLP